jgi:hypothetical protein
MFKLKKKKRFQSDRNCAVSSNYEMSLIGKSCSERLNSMNLW